MSMNVVTLLYLLASVCFIQALKGLSNPKSARAGNVFGMAGMAIAILTTVALIVKQAALLGSNLALGLGLLFAALVIAARRRGTERTLTWRAVQGGALGLIAALIVGGFISFFAFDALFETFHRIFFPGGSYDFHPATEPLAQPSPFQFSQETAIAVGVVSIVIAMLVALLAARRLDRAADALPLTSTLERSRS